MSSDEKRVILSMLGAEVEGAEALRDQVEASVVLRHWIDGLPSIDIIVSESCPHPASRRSLRR